MSSFFLAIVHRPATPIMQTKPDSEGEKEAKEPSARTQGNKAKGKARATEEYSSEDDEETSHGSDEEISDAWDYNEDADGEWQ